MADLLSWFLATGTGITVVTAALRWWVKTSIEPKLKSEAEAAGKLGAEKELEAYRAETAKLVESHKAELSEQAERVKARFQRQLTDYAIYVERRHDAVRNVYTAVIMAKGLAYGIGEVHKAEPDHLTRLKLCARDAVYALAGAYQLNVLYLPPPVHDQFVEVQTAFSDVLIMRENAHRSLDLQPALQRMEESVTSLAIVCRAELQSSAA